MKDKGYVGVWRGDGSFEEIEASELLPTGPYVSGYDKRGERYYTNETAAREAVERRKSIISSFDAWYLDHMEKCGLIKG